MFTVRFISAVAGMPCKDEKYATRAAAVLAAKSNGYRPGPKIIIETGVLARIAVYVTK